MKTTMRTIACAFLLISGLGYHATALPLDSSLAALDAQRASEWDSVFARADQEHDLTRWIALTRSLVNPELSETELELLERYTHARLARRLQAQLQHAGVGQHLREFDQMVSELNREYLYLVNPDGTLQRDDQGDVRLRGTQNFAEDLASWDIDLDAAAEFVMERHMAELYSAGSGLLTGLDPDSLQMLGALYPEAMKGSLTQFADELALSAAAARRRFIESRTLDIYSLRAGSEAQTAEIIAAQTIARLDGRSSLATLASPELIGTAQLIEQARLMASWEDEFRAEYERGVEAWMRAEDSLIEERLRWENASLQTIRMAESAWDEAWTQLNHRRESWFSEIEHTLAEVRTEFQQRMDDLMLEHSVHQHQIEEHLRAEQQHLMTEFNAIMEQVHSLGELHRVASSQRAEAVYQRDLLSDASREQAVAAWSSVLHEIELERAALLRDLMSYETEFLQQNAMPRSVYEELRFLEAEIDRLADAVSRAEAVVAYAHDLSSHRATAAESYELYAQAAEDYRAAEAVVSSMLESPEAQHERRSILLAELDQRLESLAQAESRYNTAQQEYARLHALYHAQDPQLLELLRAEYLEAARTGLASVEQLPFLAFLDAAAGTLVLSEELAYRELRSYLFELEDAFAFIDDDIDDDPAELRLYSLSELEFGLVELNAVELELIGSRAELLEVLERTGFSYEPALVDQLLLKLEHVLAEDSDIAELHELWHVLRAEFEDERDYQLAAREFFDLSGEELYELIDNDNTENEPESWLQAAARNLAEYHPLLRERNRALQLEFFKNLREHTLGLTETEPGPHEQVSFDPSAVESLLDALAGYDAWSVLHSLLSELQDALAAQAELTQQMSGEEQLDAAVTAREELATAIAGHLLLLPQQIEEAESLRFVEDAELAAFIHLQTVQSEAFLEALGRTLDQVSADLGAATEIYMTVAEQAALQEETGTTLLSLAQQELEEAEAALLVRRQAVEGSRDALAALATQGAVTAEMLETALARRTAAKRVFEEARELYEFAVAGYTLEANSPEELLTARVREHQRYIELYSALRQAYEEGHSLGATEADPGEANRAVTEILDSLNRVMNLTVELRTDLDLAEIRRAALEREVRDHTASLVVGGADWNSLQQGAPFSTLRSVDFSTQRSADWFESYRSNGLGEDFGVFAEQLTARAGGSGLLERFALAYYADTVDLPHARIALTIETDSAVRRLANITGFSTNRRLTELTTTARTHLASDPTLWNLYEHYRVLVYHGVFQIGTREINNDVSGRMIDDLLSRAQRLRDKWKKQMKMITKAHKYLELRDLRDETRARMRAVARRSGAEERVRLISCLEPISSLRAQLSSLPLPAEYSDGSHLLSDAEIWDALGPVLARSAADKHPSPAQINEAIAALRPEDRSSWVMVLRAFQLPVEAKLTEALEADADRRSGESEEHEQARQEFRAALAAHELSQDELIALGASVLLSAPQNALLESNEVWRELEQVSLTVPVTALLLRSIEERFLHRFQLASRKGADNAGAIAQEIVLEFNGREAMLRELLAQGAEHWESSLLRFVGEREDRRRSAEQRYHEGVRGFELEALYLAQQRDSWLSEAVQLGAESEAQGRAERLGLSRQRLLADLPGISAAAVSMELPDLAAYMVDGDTLSGARVLDLIATARALGVGSGSIAPYLPSGVGVVSGYEERATQRAEVLARLIDGVEQAINSATAVETVRGIEDGRRRALEAVTEANRRVGGGLAELLERHGFTQSGTSFRRRIIADRTVIGGVEHERQSIRAYRDYQAPELQIDLPSSEVVLSQLSAGEIESIALQASRQLDDYLLLIFGGENTEEGLLWIHVGSAGKNGRSGDGETGRILSALAKAQFEQKLGIEQSKTAIHNQRLFDTGIEYLEAPSIREIGVLWGQAVGAIAGAEVGAAIGRLAMQAVFTGLDLYTGESDWQGAALTMGVEVGSLALTYATAGAFQQVDEALSLTGQGGVVGVATRIGLEVAGTFVNQTGTRALAAVEIGNSGLGFDRDRFSDSVTSREAVTGYIAGGLGAGVTHGLGAVTLSDQRMFGFATEHYDGVAGFNSYAGSLTAEAVRYARDGELHLNLLNLNLLYDDAQLGLLELRLGSETNPNLSLGSGGMDTSYSRVSTALGGLQTMNENRRIGDYAHRHHDGSEIAAIALRTIYAFGDDSAQRATYRTLLAGEDRLVLVDEDQQYRALTTYDHETGGRTITVRSNGGDRYDGLALGVTLGHEAYRDGIVDAGNRSETLEAVVAHTEMAGRIAADDRYGRRYLLADPDVLVDLAMREAGEQAFAEYVAARYDSSRDYWLIVEGTDGSLALLDDGRAGVYYRGAGGEEHEIGRYRDGDRLEHLASLLSGLGSSVEASELAAALMEQGAAYAGGLSLDGVFELESSWQDMLGARLDYSRLFVEDWRSSGNMDRTVMELAGMVGRSYSYGDHDPDPRERNLAFLYGEASEFYRDFLDGRAQDHLFYQHQIEDSTGFARNTLCAATIAINAHQLVDPTISMWQIANALERAGSTTNAAGLPAVSPSGYVADLHAYTRIIAQEFGSDKYLRAIRDFGTAESAWQAGADAVFVKYVNDLVNPTREHHTLTYRYREDDRYRTQTYGQFDPYAPGLSWEQQLAVRYRSMAFRDL